MSGVSDFPAKVGLFRASIYLGLTALLTIFLIKDDPLMWNPQMGSKLGDMPVRDLLSYGGYALIAAAPLAAIFKIAHATDNLFETLRQRRSGRRGLARAESKLNDLYLTSRSATADLSP